MVTITLCTRQQKRHWCWEGLGAGGEEDDRGWDGWMASLTRWTWVSVNSGSWWWTGRPGVLRFMGLQRVGHGWATDLIWYTLTAWKTEYTVMLMSLGTKTLNMKQRIHKHEMKGKEAWWYWFWIRNNSINSWLFSS